MHRVLSWLLVGYVVSLPLIGATVFVEPFTGKAVVLADLFFFAALGAVAFAGPQRRLPFQVGVAFFAGALLVALALSAVMAPGGHAIQEFARAAYSMVVLVVFSHLRLAEPERRRLADAWTATAAVLALLAGLGYVAEIAFGLTPGTFTDAGSASLGPSTPRVASVMHANALVLYLTVSLPLALYTLARRSSRTSGWGGPLVVVFVTVGALTFSRGFAGLMLTLALVAHQFERPGWLRRWRRLLTAVAVVCVAAVVMTLVWSILPLERRGDVSLGIRVNMRAPAYSLLHVAAVRMFVAHPVFGVGLGNFRAAFCSYTTPAERAQVWPPLGCDWLPHSTWLGYAAEGGVFAVGAWIALFAGIAMMLRARLTRNDAGLATAAVAALAGLSFDGAHIDFTHLKFVWAFLGLGLAARYTDDDGRI